MPEAAVPALISVARVSTLPWAPWLSCGHGHAHGHPHGPACDHHHAPKRAGAEESPFVLEDDEKRGE